MLFILGNKEWLLMYNKAKNLLFCLLMVKLDSDGQTRVEIYHVRGTLMYVVEDANSNQH